MGRIAQAQRSAVDIFAHGENRAQGMRDDFVGGGARQMGCGANAARGVADTKNDQIRRAFFGCFCAARATWNYAMKNSRVCLRLGWDRGFRRDFRGGGQLE